MTEIRETIIRNLKHICSEKGVRNVDIAEHMNVSQGSVTNWFKGTNFIDIDNLYELCRFLGITLDDVLPESGKPTLNNDERRLVSAYRGATPEIRSAALRMLEDSAANQATKKQDTSKEVI